MDLRTKISGLILNNNHELLIFRSKGKEVWTCPGGKLEEAESDLECLKRELKEEANIDLIKADFLLETPIEKAAGDPSKSVIMRFYIVKDFSGSLELNPEDNVGEMKWLSLTELNEENIEVGSGLSKYAIPKLIELGLIK